MVTRLAIAVLVASLVAGGCRRDRQPASAQGQPASSPPAAADGQTALKAYLPQPNDLPGWARTKAVQAYGPDNLWEFIDGAADTYVGYGFQEALATGFRASGADVGLEVYQMADPLHAFGIFAQERSPGVRALSVGDEGYSSSNVVNFRKGSCYVKIAAATPDKPGAAALTALAQAVAARIPAGAALPRDLTSFPAAGLVEHSIRFLPKDVLGQRDLQNGFEATYEDGGVASRLVAIPFESATDAAAAFGRYRAFVSTSATLRVPPRGLGSDRFAGDDRYSGRVVGARAGRIVAVSIGAASDAAAAARLAGYFEKRGQDTP